MILCVQVDKYAQKTYPQRHAAKNYREFLPPKTLTCMKRDKGHGARVFFAFCVPFGTLLLVVLGIEEFQPTFYNAYNSFLHNLTFASSTTMGNTPIKAIPARNPVSVGKIRLCVGGFTFSHHTSRASTLARKIVSKYPDEYESWFYLSSKGYGGLLEQIKAEMTEDQREKFSSHKTSPFCWIETSDGKKDCLGGRDMFCKWADEKFPEDSEIQKLTMSEPSLTELFVDETPGTAK
jgi:hypothetical protein